MARRVTDQAARSAIGSRTVSRPLDQRRFIAVRYKKKRINRPETRHRARQTASMSLDGYLIIRRAERENGPKKRDFRKMGISDSFAGFLAAGSALPDLMVMHVPDQKSILKPVSKRKCTFSAEKCPKSAEK